MAADLHSRLCGGDFLTVAHTAAPVMSRAVGWRSVFGMTRRARSECSAMVQEYDTANKGATDVKPPHQGMINYGAVSSDDGSNRIRRPMEGGRRGDRGGYVVRNDRAIEVKGPFPWVSE